MMTLANLFTRRNRSALMLGIGSVFAGTACAALRGNAEYLPATLCLLFTVFAQLSGNLYYRSVDVYNSLGANVDSLIRKGKTQPGDSMLKEGSQGMLFLAAMCGLCIAGMSGAWILVVGVFVFGIAWLQVGGSHPLLRSPYGIIGSFLLFGPVCVICTSLIQSMHEAEEPLNWFDITPSLYMGIVMGLMAVNSTIMHGYATFLTDLRNSKMTFVTKFGRKATRIVFLINSIVYTGVTVFMCLQLHLDIAGVDMLPSALCLIFDIYIWHLMRRMPRYKLESLVAYCNFNALLMGVLSFIIFEINGLPDDSHLMFFGI